MTVSIRISVNGNYKVPISYKQGKKTENREISGFGSDKPVETNISFGSAAEAMTLTIGPETPDKGPEPKG